MLQTGEICTFLELHIPVARVHPLRFVLFTQTGAVITAPDAVITVLTTYSVFLHPLSSLCLAH
jgi:hypothetical protein